MKCENCNKKHDGSYGSGRFCGSKCARGFSTKYEKIKTKKIKCHHCNNKIIVNKRASKGYCKDCKKKFCGYVLIKEINSIKELSKRTITKIFKRMNLGCSICDWSESVGDLHHIKQKQNGGSDDQKNLSYLCPNHHRLADRKIIVPESLISFEDQVGDDWKQYYYIKSN